MSLEHERLHLKAESEKWPLRSTLSRLAAVVEPERDGVAIPEVEGHRWSQPADWWVGNWGR